MDDKNISRSQRYWSLALAFRMPDAKAPNDLKIAYSRLFLYPSIRIIHPYESTYVEGQLMGDTAAQIVDSYIDAGLQLNADEHELPDHVSVEMAFMAYLAARAETDTAMKWQQYQRSFLFEHLAHWLPQFFKKVEESAIHPFYCEAASMANKIIDDDLSSFSLLPLDSEKYAIPNPQIGISISSTHEHQLSVNRYPGKRFPNIHIDFDLPLCTLCTVCVDNCRSGALAVDCTPRMIRLSFDPARCNGCRKCMRLCPEQAINIIIKSPLTSPPSSQRNVVAKAPRVICPRCNRPHIAEPWLKRLATHLGNGESVQYSLALCPFCKTTAIERSPNLVGSLQEASTGV